MLSITSANCVTRKTYQAFSTTLYECVPDLIIKISLAWSHVPLHLQNQIEWPCVLHESFSNSLQTEYYVRLFAQGIGIVAFLELLCVCYIVTQLSKIQYWKFPISETNC